MWLFFEKKEPIETAVPCNIAGNVFTAHNRWVDKTLKKYASFAEVKADEYREWQAMPAHNRLEAASELSMTLYRWKDSVSRVQPGLQRTLIRLQRARG